MPGEEFMEVEERSTLVSSTDLSVTATLATRCLSSFLLHLCPETLALMLDLTFCYLMSASLASN